jgi:creatinine amidohydrolase
MLHGYTPPARYLPYLSHTQIAALPDKANTVIVLPAGSTEQHGPHLPCSVDATIAAGVIGHALARLPAEIPAYALPPISYGKSDEHLHFPGTVTLDGTTLLETIVQIGESVYRSGFRKLLIVNAHGGQPQVMEMAARELRLRHGDYVVVPHFVWRVAHAAGRYLSERDHAGAGARDRAHGRGGGELPTRVRCPHAVGRWPPGRGLDGAGFRHQRRDRRPTAGHRRTGPSDPRLAR